MPGWMPCADLSRRDFAAWPRPWATRGTNLQRVEGGDVKRMQAIGQTAAFAGAWCAVFMTLGVLDIFWWLR